MAKTKGGRVKTILMFDENSRKEYLSVNTRKKKKAKQLKLAKKKNRGKSIKKQISQNSTTTAVIDKKLDNIVKESAENFTSKVVNLPNHTVTIIKPLDDLYLNQTNELSKEDQTETETSSSIKNNILRKKKKQNKTNFKHKNYSHVRPKKQIGKKKKATKRTNR